MSPRRAKRPHLFWSSAVNALSCVWVCVCPGSPSVPAGTVTNRGPTMACVPLLATLHGASSGGQLV